MYKSLKRLLKHAARDIVSGRMESSSEQLDAFLHLVSQCSSRFQMSIRLVCQQAGLVTDGPLKGQSLQSVPGATVFDWAWEDFYPESGFYEPGA